MRKEITEEQITELMQMIPRAEEVDRLRAENEGMRAEIERLRADRRDRIATAMMAALIAKPDIRWNADDLAQSAIYHADQLIWQLDKESRP